MSAAEDAAEDSSGKPGGNDENQSNDPIVEPSEVDVLCGRGGMSNHHPGNEWYRRLIRSNRPLYRACPKHTKLLVSKAIVQAVEQQGGRFLERNKKSGVWIRVSYKRAVDKTSQGLRERDREEDHTRENLPEVPASFRGNRGGGSNNPNLSDLAEVAIAHATRSTGAPPPSAAASTAKKRAAAAAHAAAGLPPSKRARPAAAVAAAPPPPPPPPAAAAPPPREEQNLSPLPPSLQVRQSSMFRMLQNSKLLSPEMAAHAQLQQQQQHQAAVAAAAGAAGAAPPVLPPPFPTKLKNLQPDATKSGPEKDAENARAAAAAAAAQQAPIAEVPAGFPPAAAPAVPTGLPPAAAAPHPPPPPPPPPGVAPSAADLLARAAALRQQGVNPAALAAATSAGLYHLAGPPPPAAAAQLSAVYPQPPYLSAATSAASLGGYAAAGLPPPPPPGYGAAPGVSALVAAPLPADPAAAAAAAAGAAGTAPHLTRLQSQVSDWLNNSFWPVPVPAQGVAPPAVAAPPRPPPAAAVAAAQQLAAPGPPPPAPQAAPQPPPPPTINSRKMSRHLAVSTATAIAKMIPPPAPSVMHDRRGLFHKHPKGGEQQELSPQQSPQAKDGSMLPAITTVPPPAPIQPVQIRTIPPIQTAAAAAAAAGTAQQPAAAEAAATQSPMPTTQTQHVPLATTTSPLPGQVQQRQRPLLSPAASRDEQLPSLTASPTTTTAALAGVPTTKAPALKSTATSELTSDLARTESELRRTELEQSVSASLLALASAPSRLFSGFTSLFGDKAGARAGTNAVVGESPATTPGPPSTGGTPPPPPPAAAAGATLPPPPPHQQVASFKKSKKSLLDDEPENPDEARLRAVPWH